MTISQNSIYQTLKQVLVFVSNYARHFTEGSALKRTADEIQTAVSALAELKVSQGTEAGNGRIQTEARYAAREALLAHLDAISRTAKGEGLKGFWLPRNRSDEALIDTANRFVQEAEAKKAVLIDRKSTRLNSSHT